MGEPPPPEYQDGETPISPLPFSAPQGPPQPQAQPAPQASAQLQATEGRLQRNLRSMHKDIKRDLFERNKYQNAKLDKKFAKLLQSDRFTGMRLGEIGNLLYDLKSSK